MTQKLTSLFEGKRFLRYYFHVYFFIPTVGTN